MKKTLLIVTVALLISGCAAAVRDGRPRGLTFGPDDYYRLNQPDRSETTAAAPSPTDMVNTLMGTDSAFAYSHGNTYPAVAVPHGMNFWTPQTGANGNGWQYTYRARRIRGFKQSHQPSPWANDYGCFSLLPTAGVLLLDEVSRASEFRHATEVARPYYYKVRLDRYGIDVEITATARAAVMRFTYPAGAPAFVVFDSFDPLGQITIDRAGRRLTGATAYKTGGAPDNFRSYFVLEFDAPITASGCWQAASRGAWLKFDTRERQTVTVRIASSFISAEQAARNLATEVGAKGFDEIKAYARAEWDRELGKVEIEGGTSAQQATFYSALYRMLLFPRRFHELDAAGAPLHYSPYDGQVHAGYLFTDTGFWDTFRALFPFYTIVYPEFDAQFLQGLLNSYREGGRLPHWSSPGYYNSMIGAHAASVIADAYVKGIRDFDAGTAWEAMVKDAEVPGAKMHSQGRYGLEWYNRLGYIPSDVGIDQSVSRSLEYAYDDFCMAQFAAAAELPADDVAKYSARALNYKNLYDPSTGFMRPKKQNGEWQSPFNPVAWGGAYTEGSAWHYTWSVFQDPAGLIALMGGREKFVAKLDAVFIMPPDNDYAAYGFKIHEIREMEYGGMGQYAHGNQPIQHAIYLYDWAGEPWKTQARARKVMDQLYTPYPNGYCGDEDNGQTSAWYVFSALGFYPVCPCTDEYALGSPLFPRATLHLPGGRSFTVLARGNGPKTLYIKSAKLNGADLTRNYITHAEILAGGTLELEMTEQPEKTRGTAPADAPFSISR